MRSLRTRLNAIAQRAIVKNAIAQNAMVQNGIAQNAIAENAIAQDAIAIDIAMSIPQHPFHASHRKKGLIRSRVPILRVRV